MKQNVKDILENKIEIEFNREDLPLLYSLINVLECGVEKTSLIFDSKTNKVKVEDNYKSISCDNVKIKKILNKGRCDSIKDAKAMIESSYWHFPSPDFKYSNIKRNLEQSIYQIHNIDCEVESFHTNIIEYE